MKSIFHIIFSITLIYFIGCSKNNTNNTNSNEEVKTNFTGAVLTPKDTLDTIPLYQQASGDNEEVDTKETLPLSIDLSSDMPPVRNQGKQNSCVGWTVGYYLKSYQEHIQKGTIYGQNADHSGTYSPAFIFNKIKIKQNCADGSHLVDGLQLLQNNGVSSWNDMPYTDQNCNSPSSSNALKNAICNKIDSFYKLMNYGEIVTDDIIYRIKTFIYNKNPVVVAIVLYKGFEQNHHTIKNGEHFYQAFEEDFVKGLHSILVVGYDTDRNAFKIINSYGKDWGNEGYLWIDYNDFKDIVKEAFITFDASNECNTTVNTPPNVDGGKSRNIEINSSITIKAEANDSDGNIVSYNWFEDNNLISVEKSFIYTPISLGKHILTVKVQDNSNSIATDTITITVIPKPDTTAPTLFISDNISGDIGVSLVNREWKANSVIFDLNFSEEVIGFDSNDIVVTNGSKSNFRGSGKNYQIDVTPPIHSTTPITISVASNKVTDGSSNGNRASSSNQSVNTVKAFITTWDTTKEGNSSSNQIKITINPNNAELNYYYTVDWGDDKSDRNIQSDIIHTYDKEGNYTVSITGNFASIYFYDYNTTKYDNEKIISIDQWGTQPWQTMENAFFMCNNLVGNFNDNPNLNNVKSMFGMFLGASLFNSNINSWNVSNVLDMTSTFARTKNFNQPLYNWDVSSVITMRSMFAETKSFNQLLNNWNVSNVTNMNSMFWEAESFNQPLENWNVSNVTNMVGMFGSDPSTPVQTIFNQPLNNWDVSNVRYMINMFKNTKSFNQPLDNWNTVNVVNMESMFEETEAFNQSLNSWNVSNVTTMKNMFSGAFLFNKPLNNWDVSSVTDMSSMFLFTNIFNQDISNWDVSNVTSMRGMFMATKVFNQDIGKWNVSNVTDMSEMFNQAYGFNQDISNWDVSNVTSMYQMFFPMNVSTGLSVSNYNKILSSWSKLNLQQNVRFDAYLVKYSPEYADKRQYIIDTFNWTITDGGVE